MGKSVLNGSGNGYQRRGETRTVSIQEDQMDLRVDSIISFFWPGIPLQL